MHDTFVDELNSVISLIYYIVMMLISVIQYLFFPCFSSKSFA